MTERKYISTSEEEEYFAVHSTDSENIENAMFLTLNYTTRSNTDFINMKQDMIDTFQIDPEVIKAYSKLDIASGGRLPMPCPGESINIRILRPPKIVGKGMYDGLCTIYGRECDLQYKIQIASNIARGIFAEMEKAGISVDNELKCIVNRVFTIVGRQWNAASKELWTIDAVTHRPVAPTVYVVALREDLEASDIIRKEDITKMPDLNEF
jgi:hypothetical protein